MPEPLPAIDIKISVAPTLFFERMIALGEEAGHFTIKHVDDRAGGAHMKVANFRFTGDCPHDELGFQLITREKSVGRIQVEMRALRWSPEPPTRAVYVQSAHDLVRPLLSRYNRAHGTRHRLRIGARAKPFKFSPLTATLLHRFTVLANTRSLHALDWGRFYRLVSKGRQEVPEQSLREKLEEAGFTSEKALELAQLYAHLWAFKRLR